MKSTHKKYLMWHGVAWLTSSRNVSKSILLNLEYRKIHTYRFGSAFGARSNWMQFNRMRTYLEYRVYLLYSCIMYVLYKMCFQFSIKCTVGELKKWTRRAKKCTLNDIVRFDGRCRRINKAPLNALQRLSYLEISDYSSESGSERKSATCIVWCIGGTMESCNQYFVFSVMLWNENQFVELMWTSSQSIFDDIWHCAS